jgi:adenosylcobinamide-phosphate synthase
MILLAALVLDLVLGEPPNICHPVAWVGRVLEGLFRVAPRRGCVAPFLYGAGAVLGTAGAVAWLLSSAWLGLASGGWIRVIAHIWLVKCSFSLRGLASAAKRVERRLAAGDLGQAQADVGRHLVSRPTDGLGPEAVASAAVESVAENLTDSFVGPVFFYLLLGLPGAWVYRVVNTADAMVGYREGELEYLGKAAARLDDLLSLIPARLAALALVGGAALVRADPRRAILTVLRDHRLTASPNAGWTIAAMAGALGVALEKPGAYRVGEGRPATGADIARSLRVLGAAAGLVSVAALTASILKP